MACGQEALAPEAEVQLWRLWDRAADLALGSRGSGSADADEPGDADGSGDADLDKAINDPGGILADALLARVGAAGPASGEGLPGAVEIRLDRLAADERAAGRLARIALAPNLHWLYEVDPRWTSHHLLRRMAWEWSSRADTLAMWRGYLFAPRYTLHLLGPLRPLLLGTLRHLDELGEQAAAEACRFFVAVCIEQPNAFSGSEIDRAIGHMAPSGLAKGAQVLEWKLRDAGGDAAELWRRRIGPWVERHWPDAAAFLAEPAVAEANDLLLETREAFPEALALLERKRLVAELAGDEGRARPQLIV